MEETNNNVNEAENIGEAPIQPTEANTESNPEAEEYYAQLQRVMADFDNYRKRTAKDKESLYSLISSEIIGEFLPVMDNLEKSINTKGDDEVSKAWRDGINMIHRQFNDVLIKLGAEEIKTVGEKFDPALHDAVMHVDDDSVGEGIIVEELRKGYRLKDRIIRHSMVKVAN
ncbi:MAG: nucleotide exchange factor GrpE [Clostridia bacterium]|nr:nucleotide exchange factor GrpE [Clostridia bacterium]